MSRESLIHGLPYVEGLAGLPTVDGCGDLVAHLVDVAGDLVAGEGGLQLMAFVAVCPAGGRDHGVAEELAHLLEEPALGEVGAEVFEHDLDELWVLDDDGSGAGLEDDLDQRSVVAAEGGDESEVVADERNHVIQERQGTCGPGYGAGRRRSEDLSGLMLVQVRTWQRSSRGRNGGRHGLRVIMRCRVPDHHNGRPCLPARHRPSPPA
ncbi:hypothetical protein AB0E64_39000 [Streptomyces caelestis]|uniref:Uncharacterized protein n=1 Tax=Streptomyces caelestis TaxID=36816 RepID=A0A7W9GYN8_9ACTN|nr:hypothetical protein [Streptomyces caelestis]MBB5792081.1 hypothetical protein [Streptomyces caelestis]